MHRRLHNGELVVATHNDGKLREINDLLRPFQVTAVSAAALGLPAPVEDGDSFLANARIKALAATQASGKVALADDSGLSVAGLAGAPGIHSARWAGPGQDFQVAMARVHDALKNGSAPASDLASFICVLALAWPDGHVECFEGRCEGSLVWPPRGEQGFGYDPMFRPLGEERTFGEMTLAEKLPLSHRARAFDQLIGACLAA